jgi:thymidylate synthase (FAD)
MLSEVKVLDHGFVKYIDHMGDDMRVVSAARISFNKKKETFDYSDEKLLAYLIDNEHTSPFRHCQVTFHVKAPIFVFRQWMRYRVASEFNEISGRYVNLGQAEFYMPMEFRYQSKDNKQGSEGIILDDSHVLQTEYEKACKFAFYQYNQLIARGVAKEQARCILPLAVYSEVYWTASLQTIAHFLNQRLDSHAQYEIRKYAEAVSEITKPLFPVSMNYLLHE